MQCTIQVVITTDEGQTETRDIACVERQDLTPTTLGLRPSPRAKPCSRPSKRSSCSSK
jgi:hypothetical protein